MVTIKQIAEMAEVSRGTVDKVLNNRPGVKKETREKVEKIIETMGYQPNPIGKALATCRTPLKIGIVMIPGYNQFIRLMVQGIRNQEAELQPYGVEVCLRVAKHLDPEEQLALLNELYDHQVTHIALFPIRDERIIQTVNKMVKEGITIITFNSRVDSIRSRFFIGQNAYKGGRTAAELITKLIPDGKIGLIISSMLLSCHEGRSAGFCDYLNACGRYSILAAAATQDMDSLAYEQTLELLHQSQDIRAIYITGGGVAGVGKALKSLHLEGKIHVICHDITPDTEYLLREKIVDFVIDQDPVRQGRLLVSSLYEYYMYGKPLNAEAADIPITIRTRETL